MSKFNFGLRDKEPTYLGDGAYCKMTGWEITIYCSDGVREYNHIYLEKSCIGNLLKYLEVKDAE